MSILISKIDTVKQKLARATGVLAKLRPYVLKKVLKFIYYAIYDSNTRYGCQSWGQRFNTRDIEKLQNKAINIINFKTGSLHLNNQLKTLVENTQTQRFDLFQQYPICI